MMNSSTYYVFILSYIHTVTLTIPVLISLSVSKIPIHLFSLEEKLPLEIILNILSYLRFEDKLSLSLTNKYLNIIANYSIYQRINLITKSKKCLETRSACCYDPEKLNPTYIPYIEQLYDYHNDDSSEALIKSAFSAVIHNPTDKLINLRNNFLINKLQFIELDKNVQLPVLNNLKSLKIHDNIDLQYCLTNNQQILQDKLSELIIVDNPMVLQTLRIKKFNNLTSLRLSINTVRRFEYAEFWSVLTSTMDLSLLKKFEINFKSSLNLCRNPYLIDLPSLQYLDEINDFLHKLSVSLVNIREISVCVEDIRAKIKGSCYKKIQPDLNQFLNSLPCQLDKVIIKLSNEFQIGQFNNFLIKHKELKNFTFFGNLNNEFVDEEFFYNLKFNMLNHGCLIKDYSMYGKFSKPILNDKIMKELEILSNRADLDYLCDNDDDMVIDNIDGDSMIKEMILKNLRNVLLSGKGQAKYKNLQKINLNGMLFGIVDGKEVTCISD